MGAAFMRGLRAQWLVVADWEALLRLPLEDVRSRLGLDTTPDYTRVYQQQPAAAAA
jgi:ubiquinone biosynthesis protein Coq4